jgi:hypothetical protein
VLGGSRSKKKIQLFGGESRGLTEAAAAADRTMGRLVQATVLMEVGQLSSPPSIVLSW